MVQGRKLEVAGLWDNIVVELGAMTQVLRPHDAREVKALDWQARTLAVLAPVIEAHGSETQRKLMRALQVNASELQRANRIEDIEHAGLFSVAEAAG